MDNDARTPGQVVGARLREVREERRLRQSDVVVSARRLGLRWTPATVAALETGRRELSVGELLLLPMIVFDATERALSWDEIEAAGKPRRQRKAEAVTLWDLFPEGGMVRLSPGAAFTGDAVREMLTGVPDPESGQFDTPLSRSASEVGRSLVSLASDCRKVWPDAPETAQQAAYEESGREGEQRTAERLGTSAFVVALGALRLWGRGVTAERDRRLIGQSPGRSGHVTRAITEELRAFLIEAGVIQPPPTTRKKRREG